MEHANQTATDVLKKINGTSFAEKIKKLETMPLEELRKAMAGLGHGWTPVTECVTLPRDPFLQQQTSNPKIFPW